MTRLLTSLLLLVACTAMAPIYPSSVMESNNIIVAPKLFWMKSVTNDIPFSNAVNAVLGPSASIAFGSGSCSLSNAGGLVIVTNASCDYTLSLDTNVVRGLVLKTFGYLTNVVTTNTSAGFTGLVQSIGITFTNGLATTGYVDAATNDLDTVLRAFIAFSIDDATGGIAHTNDVIDATNGLDITLRAVIDSATNALASTNYVVTATNNLDTALRSVIASATNGHALLAEVVAATNTIDAAKITVGTLGAARLPFTFLTNNQVGPTTLYGDAQKTNGVTISSSGEVLSNALGNVVISSGNVTASGNFLSTNGTYTGNGSGLTNLSASALPSVLTSQVQASNVLSGGTIPVGAINGLAPTFLANLLITNSAVATNGLTNPGIILTNGTVATTNAQQESPAILLRGHGYKTTATAGTQPVGWAVKTTPVQGTANPSANLVFISDINGTLTTNLALSSASVLTIGTAGTVSDVSGQMKVNGAGSGAYLTDGGNGVVAFGSTFYPTASTIDIGRAAGGASQMFRDIYVTRFITNASNGTVTIGASNTVATGLLVSSNSFASYKNNTAANTSITVGSSPFSWTNTTGFNVFVDIDANGATTAVQRNGSSIFGTLATGDHEVFVKPNGYLTVTYSVATPIMGYTEN